MLVTAEKLTKLYHGIPALEAVDLELRPGEILGLVGENGAGKSTLVKILAGVQRPDSGQISIEGQPYRPESPAEARSSGIAVIHQDFQLVPDLPVAANILLAQAPVKRVAVFFDQIDHKEMVRRAGDILETLGLKLDPSTLVRNLGVAERQLVEIARALTGRARLLIMDEPTASLERREVYRLFSLMRSLRERGTGLIFVSHRLDEVLEVTDRITVLRNGKSAGTRLTSEVSPGQLIQMIVGQEIAKLFPREPGSPGDLALEAKDLAGPGVEKVSITAHQGEIVALTGLMGSGAAETLKLVAGQTPPSSGYLAVGGQPVSVREPANSIAAGIGYVPEDRRHQGLIPNLSIEDNIALTNLNRVARFGFISRKRVRSLAGEWIKSMKVRTAGPQSPVQSLSGGNQQKVVIAKWLAGRSKVLAMCEPTHGIDVGAKVEVNRLMGKFAKDGGSVIFSSLELPEVAGMGDRVVAFRHGRVENEFSSGQATPEALMASISGVAAPTQSQAADHSHDVEHPPASTPRPARDWSPWLLPTIFTALIITLSVLNPHFLTTGNLLNVLHQFSILALVSAGMTFVIIGGGFDLSVGSVVALSGSVAALVMIKVGLAAGVVAGLATGALAGITNGLLVSRAGISPFIATLGTLVLCRGLALGITGGTAVFDLPRQFAWLGSGKLLGVPVPVLSALLVFLGGLVIMNFHTFGLKVYAVGGNREAARLSGINVPRVIMTTYLICGLTAGLAGLVLAARIRAGEPTAATFLELFSIAAVVLGGTSLRGGEGSLARTLLGVLFIGFLENGLNLMNIPFYWQQVVIGVVFILAAALGMLRRHR